MLAIVQSCCLLQQAYDDRRMQKISERKKKKVNIMVYIPCQLINLQKRESSDKKLGVF